MTPVSFHVKLNMEAVGAGASSLAFVLLALKSAKIIHGSLATVKDAPRIVHELVQDVQLLQSVLGRLTHYPLGRASNSTISSLEHMLQTCTAELSSIESRLAKFTAKPDSGRSNRVYKGILAYVKKEDLEDARNKIRDKTTQVNLYLGLLQAQAISDASSKIDHQASSTTVLLEHILGEVARLHDRLANDNASATKTQSSTVDDSSMDDAVTESLEAMTLCSELEQSISRLSCLVDHDGLTLSADDAEQIVDDLRKFLAISRDKIGSNKAPLHAYSTKEDGELRRDLKLIEGLILSAPIVAINKPGTEYSHSLDFMFKNFPYRQSQNYSQTEG